MSLFQKILNLLKKMFGSSSSDNPDVPPNVENPPPTNNPPTGETKMKLALCTGINKYSPPISQLAGCVADAKNFKAVLEGYGFVVTLLLDEQCRKDAILSTLKSLLAKTAKDDLFVWTNSSHGSRIRDANGDEPDGQDEVIVTVEGQYIVDDEIRVIFDEAIARGVRIQIISDSCHSGTLTRAIPEATEDYRQVRWVEPALLGKEATVEELPTTPIFYSAIGEEAMGEILLSGCLNTEYSYDATIEGQSTGAMSYYAVKAIRATPQGTWNEIYASIRKNLPSSKYPQTPQLEGKTENKGKIVFS